ncbi:MAG: Cell surface protein [Ignavibacteriae bacterium]|nr:MAG: Cell surface protein [Ignavibacteriota bacterium]
MISLLKLTQHLHDTLSVNVGWNMIGSISQEIPVSHIQSEPAGMITSQFYGYNNGYFVSNTILPGKAYWVKVNSKGKLILSASNEKTEERCIKIIPINEYPPNPPGESILLNIPTEFNLEQNYPNPFNPSTIIKYAIPEECIVHISIYNILGQEVIRLVDEQKEAGYYTIELKLNEKLSSGVYYYRMEASSIKNVRNYTNVKKMLLLR